MKNYRKYSKPSLIDFICNVFYTIACTWIILMWMLTDARIPMIPAIIIYLVIFYVVVGIACLIDKINYICAKLEEKENGSEQMK